MKQNNDLLVALFQSETESYSIDRKHLLLYGVLVIAILLNKK